MKRHVQAPVFIVYTYERVNFSVLFNRNREIMAVCSVLMGVGVLSGEVLSPAAKPNPVYTFEKSKAWCIVKM